MIKLLINDEEYDINDYLTTKKSINLFNTIHENVGSLLEHIVTEYKNSCNRSEMVKVSLFENDEELDSKLCLVIV